MQQEEYEEYHYLKTQLHDEVYPLIYITAFIEVVLLIVLTSLTDGMQTGGEGNHLSKYLPYLLLGFFMLTGLFCVDMSLVVLQFFERYFDKNTDNTNANRSSN